MAPLSNSQKQSNYRARLKEKKLLEESKPSVNLADLSIVDFFTKVTGLIPTPKQCEVLNALVDERISNILISSGRQTGKSLCCAVSAIYLGLKSKKLVALVSAKTNYVFQHLQEIFSTNAGLVPYIKWQGVAAVVPKDGLELTNGSRIQLLTSSEKGVRGASASVLYLDEAELMPNETLSSVYGNLSGAAIKLIVLGTPSSHYSRFNEILKHPQKYNFTVFHWTELDCSWHTPEELANKKSFMSTDEWQRDVEGLLSEADTKLLWDSELINRCIRETVLSEGKPREAGIDGGGFGVTNRDKLSLTIIERIGKFKEKILLSRVWGLEDIAGAYSEIGRLLREYKVVLVKVDSLPVDTIERVKEVYDKSKCFSVNAKFFKEECQGQLSHIIEGQGLEIPAEYEELIQEMKSYKKTGRPHYDDRVDSLLLATYSNDVLFPIKPATGGCAVFINVNDHSTFGNYGKYLNNAPSNNNSVSFPNRFKKGLCSR
jgi:hypothetical protein